MKLERTLRKRSTQAKELVTRTPESEALNQRLGIDQRKKELLYKKLKDIRHGNFVGTTEQAYTAADRKKLEVAEALLILFPDEVDRIMQTTRLADIRSHVKSGEIEILYLLPGLMKLDPAFFEELSYDIIKVESKIEEVRQTASEYNKKGHALGPNELADALNLFELLKRSGKLSEGKELAPVLTVAALNTLKEIKDEVTLKQDDQEEEDDFAYDWNDFLSFAFDVLRFDPQQHGAIRELIQDHEPEILVFLKHDFTSPDKLAAMKLLLAKRIRVSKQGLLVAENTTTNSAATLPQRLGI